MSALNRPDNFAGRVNYAAKVIVSGRPSTRAFDNCFENYDGDVVSAALVRRAERNKRLAENLPRYLNTELALKAFERFKGLNLTEEARKAREEAKAKFNKFMEARLS